MKKIIYILVFLPFFTFGQTVLDIQKLDADTVITTTAKIYSDGTNLISKKDILINPGALGYLYLNTTGYYLAAVSNLLIYNSPATHLMRINGNYRAQFNDGDFSPYSDLLITLGQVNARFGKLFSRNFTDSVGFSKFTAPVYIGSSGVVRGEIYQNGNDFVMRNLTQDGDLILGVNDGGSSQAVITIDGATHHTSVSGEFTTDNSFGELWDNAGTVIATTTVYRTITSWQAGDFNEVTLGDSSITVTQAGTYLVNYSSSFTHSVNNTTCHVSLFVNGTEDVSLEAERKIGTAGDVGSMSGTALVTLTANAVLKLRTIVDNAGNTTFNHINFNVTRIK